MAEASKESIFNVTLYNGIIQVCKKDKFVYICTHDIVSWSCMNLPYSRCRQFAECCTLFIYLES